MLIDNRLFEYALLVDGWMDLATRGLVQNCFLLSDEAGVVQVMQVLVWVVVQDVVDETCFD